jgi:hypothetical protein
LITYTAGYSTIPEYVKECCAKMVAVELALSDEFRTSCKDTYKKYQGLISDWLGSIEFLLNTFIRVAPLSVKTIGKWRSETFVQQLQMSTAQYDD